LPECFSAHNKLQPISKTPVEANAALAILPWFNLLLSLAIEAVSALLQANNWV
jgi:hypothetical protein